MQIDIQSRGFSLTDALVNYSEQRLIFSMSHFSDHINKVVVRLSDINGPRGGKDKCCHLRLIIAGLPNIVVKDTEINMYAAIDRAMDRIRRAVARRLDRQRTLLKRSHPFSLEEQVTVKR